MLLPSYAEGHVALYMCVKVQATNNRSLNVKEKCIN